MSEYKFPYLNPTQTRTREPTDWEMSLAGALEEAFGAGHYELDDLIAALNASRVRPRDGGTWTVDGFTTLMHELGA